MARKKRKNREEINPLVIVSLVIISLAVGATIGQVIPDQSEKLRIIDNRLKVIENDFDENLLLGENEIMISVPAIDEDGNGVSTGLIVKIEEGSGRTLVDIDTLLFWVDTQNSIRMAKIVAANITGLDLENYDITYRINADATLIGGESAGAALTVATVAALQNKEIRDDVMITGTINHDGTIGPIGGILEKAKAAKDFGKTTFLVPLLQGNEIVYEERRHCEKFGALEWCNTERVPTKKDVSLESGISIIEVGNIEEALDYFLIS